MDRENYNDIIVSAESGDPHAMLRLAKLYRAGFLPDPYYDNYIYWLKYFFKSPYVVSLIHELEDRYSEENQEDEINVSTETDDFIESTQPIDELSPLEYFVLRGDIKEAGLLLGLFYKSSNNIEYLELSANALMAARDAGRGEFISDLDEDGIERSIEEYLAMIEEKINELKGGEGEWQSF